MPKMKTRKAAAKRYKVTATGKVMYKKQGLSTSSPRRTQSVKEIFATQEFLVKPRLRGQKSSYPTSFKGGAV